MNPFQPVARLGNATISANDFAQMCSNAGVGTKAEILRCIMDMNGGQTPPPMNPCDAMTLRRKQAEAKKCFTDEEVAKQLADFELQFMDAQIYSKRPITVATGSLDFFLPDDEIVQGIRNLKSQRLFKGEIFICTDIRLGYGVLPAGSNGGNVDYFRRQRTGTDTNNNAGTPNDLTEDEIAQLDAVIANSELYVKIDTVEVMRYNDCSWFNSPTDTSLPQGQLWLNSPWVLRGEKQLEVQLLTPATFTLPTGFALGFWMYGFKVKPSHVRR